MILLLTVHQGVYDVTLHTIANEFCIPMSAAVDVRASLLITIKSEHESSEDGLLFSSSFPYYSHFLAHVSESLTILSFLCLFKHMYTCGNIHHISWYKSHSILTFFIQH